MIYGIYTSKAKGVTTQMKLSKSRYFLMAVFTMLLNRVHVFENVMFHLNRNMAVNESMYLYELWCVSLYSGFSSRKEKVAIPLLDRLYIAKCEGLKSIHISIYWRWGNSKFAIPRLPSLMPGTFRVLSDNKWSLISWQARELWERGDTR